MSSGLIWRQLSFSLERAACYRTHIAPTLIQAFWRGRMLRTCVGSQLIIPVGAATAASADWHSAEVALTLGKGGGSFLKEGHTQKKEQIDPEDSEHENSSCASLDTAKPVWSPDDFDIADLHTSMMSSGVMHKPTTEANPIGRAVEEYPSLSVMAEQCGQSNRSEVVEDESSSRCRDSNSIHDTNSSESREIAAVSYVQPLRADHHAGQRNRDCITEQGCLPIRREEVSSPKFQACQPDRVGSCDRLNWTNERELSLQATLVDEVMSEERDVPVKGIDIRKYSYECPDKEADDEDENVYDFDLDVMDGESVDDEVDSACSLALPIATDVYERASSKSMECELVKEVDSHGQFELALPNTSDVCERDSSIRQDEDCEEFGSESENGGDNGDEEDGTDLSPSPQQLSSELERDSELTIRRVDVVKEPLCLQKRESRLRPSLKHGVSSRHRSDTFKARRVSLGMEGATTRRVVCFNSDDPPSVVGSTPDEPPEENRLHDSYTFSITPPSHNRSTHPSIPSMSTVHCNVQGSKFGGHDDAEYEHEDIYDFYSFDGEDYEEDCDFEENNVDDDVSKTCACFRLHRPVALCRIPRSCVYRSFNRRSKVCCNSLTIQLPFH